MKFLFAAAVAATVASAQQWGRRAPPQMIRPSGMRQQQRIQGMVDARIRRAPPTAPKMRRSSRQRPAGPTGPMGPQRQGRMGTRTARIPKDF